jgi:hypothetical protein
MPVLDDLVRDAVGGLVAPVPTDAVVADVAARRRRRRRTRRLTTAGLATVAIGLMGLGASALDLGDEPPEAVFAANPDPTSTPDPTHQPASPPPEENGGFALWPEDTPAEWLAATDKPAWRSDSVETARQFAAEVLGWTDAVQPELVMPEAYGRHYRVAREPGGPVVVVHMEERQVCPTGQSCPASLTPAWSVMAVNDEPMPCEDPMPACFTLDVSAEDGAAVLRFGMLGAASADVEVSSGASVRATTTTGEVRLTTLDRALTDPGYVLLLFRDAGGRVSNAYGYMLGPADFEIG